MIEQMIGAVSTVTFRKSVKTFKFINNNIIRNKTCLVPAVYYILNLAKFKEKFKPLKDSLHILYITPFLGKYIFAAYCNAF